MSALKMWAGVECTLNRMGDRYISQCDKSGHAHRIEDLELFAGLGIERLRYPCLWETVAPDGLEQLDWSWLDERLPRMRELGLTPIAGLLHHGSGPRYTALNDPEFPEKFAAYARAFSERYPWIEDYTPINEPLTTARFSCLYGIWYPHLNDDREFARAVYNQAKGTVLAMREIRKVNPKARLIQTEDLGRAQSTPVLKYQVEFENLRRWLSYDLLCGAIVPGHGMYRFLHDRGGLKAADLEWLRENATAPDIIGINHYLLSNRYLDHRLELFDPRFHGGNGKHRYADIGAVDTEWVMPPEPKSVFREAWERYKIPLAVTEVHVLGHREAQMRWMKQIWDSARELRGKGVDIRAVTAWSLLGTYDWNSLCTKCDLFYEPGVFDLRSPRSQPKPTAISRMVTGLSSAGEYDHPLLDQAGWWMRPQPSLNSRPLLITGARGTLGRAFARVCDRRGIAYRIVGRDQMDIANEKNVRAVLAEMKPWGVVNTAGYVKVDLAESESERCFRENVHGAVNLANACRELGIPYVTFSSDLVFDGTHQEAYDESHPVAPLNVYGRSKAEGENGVLGAHPHALVIRTSSFFGPWDEYNFVTQTLRSLQQKQLWHAASDIRVSPTYVPDLVNTSLDLLIDGEHGLLHLTNEGGVTWAELARQAASAAKLDTGLIVDRAVEEFRWPAPRPRNSVLTSQRVKMLPPLEDALGRYMKEMR